MSLSIGIVGLPNVGKSTLFNLLTQNKVEASNYPFCTIDPHVGCVRVPDDRLDKLTQISQSAKTIPTMIEFVDIAGLVKGAHTGEGLGNKFLANIREVDAICHVIRSFKDKNIVHVCGQIDPCSDKDIIETELIMADLQSVENKLASLKKTAKGKISKETSAQIAFLEQMEQRLKQGKFANNANISDELLKFHKSLNLLTAKPKIYVLNCSEESQTDITGLNQTGQEHIIQINAKIEQEIMDLEPEERIEYLKELNINQSGLDKLIVTSYHLLELITFFTSGQTETRAWTIKQGTLAPQAAGTIHTDFEKGFIRAEVIAYNDFISCQGENGAKEKGLMRLEGKEYPIQDGDVCHFRFNI